MNTSWTFLFNLVPEILEQWWTFVIQLGPKNLETSNDELLWSNLVQKPWTMTANLIGVNQLGPNPRICLCPRGRWQQESLHLGDARVAAIDASKRCCAKMTETYWNRWAKDGEITFSQTERNKTSTTLYLNKNKLLVLLHRLLNDPIHSFIFFASSIAKVSLLSPASWGMSSRPL